MKVFFNSDISGGGVMSSISWNSDEFMQALRVMFRAKSDEKITAVSLTPRGITVKIEMVDPTNILS